VHSDAALDDSPDSDATAASLATTGRTRAEGQFGIADQRSAHSVAEMLRKSGLDPVWKDWDASILATMAA
jgi:2-iminoacetate synthase ThiH